MNQNQLHTHLLGLLFYYTFFTNKLCNWISIHWLRLRRRKKKKHHHTMPTITSIILLLFTTLFFTTILATTPHHRHLLHQPFFPPSTTTTTVSPSPSPQPSHSAKFSQNWVESIFLLIILGIHKMNTQTFRTKLDQWWSNLIKSNFIIFAH